MAAVESIKSADDDSWLYGDSEGHESQKQTLVNGGSAPVISAPPEAASDSGQKDAGIDDDDEDDDDDDDDDDVQVTIGEIKPVMPDQKFKPIPVPGLKPVVKGVDIDAQGTINGVPTFEVDVQAIAVDERPWRKPGADITDFFNYGFNEVTWANYCNKQNRLRHMNGDDSVAHNFPPPMSFGMPSHPPPTHMPPMSMPPRIYSSARKDPVAISVIGSTARDSRRPISPPSGPPPPGLQNLPPPHTNMMRMYTRPPVPLPGQPYSIPPPSLPRPALLPLPLPVGAPPSFMPPHNTHFDPFYTSQPPPPPTDGLAYQYPPYGTPYVPGPLPPTPASWETQSVVSDYPSVYSPSRRSPSVSGSDDEYGGRYRRGRYYDEREKRRREHSTAREHSADRDTRSMTRARSRSRDREPARGGTQDRVRERSREREREAPRDYHKSRSSRKYRTEDESDLKNKRKKSSKHTKRDKEDKEDSTTTEKTVGAD